MDGDILNLLENRDFVAQTIRRIAKDESIAIAFPDFKPPKDWNPDGVPMSVVWHCLENAVVSYGPIAESNINLVCNVKDTHAGVTVELALSIEYIDKKPFLTVMHVEQLIEE